jgi:hypothetical protein
VVPAAVVGRGEEEEPGFGAVEGFGVEDVGGAGVLSVDPEGEVGVEGDGVVVVAEVVEELAEFALGDEPCGRLDGPEGGFEGRGDAHAALRRAGWGNLPVSPTRVNPALRQREFDPRTNRTPSAG